MKNILASSLVLVIMIVGVSIVVGIVMALPIMLLWNGIMPSLFHVREISFFEAWGMFVLSSILFKSSKVEE